MVFSDNPNLEVDKRTLNDYLKDNNLNITKTKITILEAIHSLKQPFELKDLLGQCECLDVSKQSVWSNVPIFLKSKVLRRIIIDENEIKVRHKYELLNNE